MNVAMNKKILLFSYNPVPTDEYKTIEGSALRFWRMALALKSKGFNDITIAVWEKFPQSISTQAGIKIMNFNNNPDHLKKMMSGFDSVIFSCAMGGLSRDLMNATNPNQQIIIDAYSPMYAEFLTKSLGKKEDAEQLTHYDYYVEVFNECLLKADYSLVANDNQRHLYRGVIAAQAALVKFDDNRFIKLPAFVEKSSSVKQKKLQYKDKISVLWFGGVYPWFDLKDIIKAFADPSIKKIAKLVIVGGSNPFYPKDNVRFNGKYVEAVELTKKLGLDGDSVVFEEWVEYHNRIKVFNQADVAISVNAITVENDYSFRLRVADLVGNGVPVITNARDVLGEDLINKQVAFRLDISSSKSLVESLKNILNNRDGINNAKKLLINSELYNELHIEGWIDNITSVIESGEQPSKAVDLTHRRFAQKDDPSVFTPWQMVEGIGTKTLLKITSRRVAGALKSKAKKMVK